MNSDISIRPMTVADIPAITAIERDVFSDPWPTSAFQEILAINNRINLIAMSSDGAILGYVLAQCVADEVHIDNIAVIPSVQKQGIGSRLLARAEEEGSARGALCSVLDVRANNDAGLALYHRFGYSMIARRRNYYRRPVCDALILFRRFDQPATRSESQEANDGMVS